MLKKRKILVISSVLLTIVLLSALAVGGFFWYLPHFRLDKLQNDYLLQHRSFIRSGQVQPGAFNKFVLLDFQLGSSDKPIFAAPRAELTMHSDIFGKFSKLPIRSLTLYGCPVKVTSAGNRIYINNILLEDLVKEFSKLPPAADGRPLILELHSPLSFGSKAPSADLHLTIRHEAGKLNISGSWKSLADKTLSGSWQAFTDPAQDDFSVSLAGNITDVFMQEIQLRSGVSAKFTALLNQGSISGSGKFSGSFRKLQIKELNYSGKVKDPVLAFYKHKISNINDFSFKLQKNNTKGVSCEIPELSLKNSKAVILQDLKLNGREKIAFSAECNFQQLAAECLLQSCSVNIKSDSPAQGRLSGEWNTASDIWQITSSRLQFPQHALHLQAVDHPIIMQLEKFDFNARGKGSAGTLTQQLKFKELEIYSPENRKKVQSSAGYFTLKTVFGSSDRPDVNTLSTACSKFSLETPWGIVEIPGFSASMEIKKQAQQKFDIFTTISSTGGKMPFKQDLLELAPWYGRFRMYIDLKDQKYQIRNLDLKSSNAVIHRNQQEITLKDAHVSVDLEGKSAVLQSALLSADASEITTGNLAVKQAALNIDFDRKRKNNELFKGNISCSRGAFPLTANWFISKAVNANMSFAGSALNRKPEKIDLQANLLDWQYGDFSGTVQNSKWLLKQDKVQSLNCTAEFDYMKLSSLADKFGSSQIGKSSLSINLAAGADGLPVRFDLMGIMAQCSWIKGDYHAGSESVQCELKYDKNSSKLMQGALALHRANILGSHITASTPALKCSFTALDSSNISGNIEFAPGTITDQSGDIELRKAAFSLPLQISTRPLQHGSAGKFTAEDVYFKQQHEGSFSGTVSHFMQLPATVTDTLAHQIEIKGNFLADKFNKKAVKLHGTWMLPPEKSSVKWQFSMPESKLVQMTGLSDYLNLPVNCTVLKGNFTLDGSAVLSADHPAESVIKLNSINSDWQIGEITAEGITSAGVVTLSDRKISLMPHDVTMAKLAWNKWLLTDNEMNLSLNSDGRLQIVNWHGSLLGGKFRATQIPAIDTTNFKSKFPATFSVENIPMTGFFNLFGINQLQSDALLAGDIQLNAGQTGLWVEKSQLAFKSPAGKILQLKLDNPSAIKMRDRQFRDFTLAVLNAMKCYQANFNLSTAPGEIFMQLKADGVPARPVPFVYQGRSGATPFRPAEPGENGFAGEIELNVNLKLHPGKTGSLK